MNSLFENGDRKLLDPQQEGFRRYHSTTYAVTRLVQSIVNGFNKNNQTLACFVDLAKAFDSVWRPGLMYKLSKIGVSGRLWMWIKNFLHDRTVQCHIGDIIGAIFHTEMGLPQGSVLAPLLFSIFIIDMFSGIDGDHCKFADDGTFWHSGDHVQHLVEKICKDIGILKDWCRKWRMQISLPKTEVTLFSQSNTDNLEPVVTVDNHVLQYNKTPKLLGVHLDEKLNFRKHIEVVSHKASRCLGVLREINGIAKLSSKKLIQLYIGLVRPVLEYGCLAWQTATSHDLKPLEIIQKKALALCLKAPITSSREALEVASGIPPIDLRLTEIAIREVAKINAKSTDHPLKLQLNQCKEQDPGSRFIGPLNLALCQATEMHQTTNISISMIQPEPAYNPGDLVRSIQQPDYWSQLGSSKNRSSAQKEMGQNIIHELLTEAPDRSSFAFTDGSCLGNPGPCGAGAVVFLPDDPSGLELTRPVAARGSILLAELVAILMVLELAVSKKISDFSSSLQIFSDSQSAVGILTLNWASTNYTVLISQIKSLLQQLQSTALDVSLHWTPGHATIAGNEIADRLAKDAAHQALEMPVDTSIVTIQDIKNSSKKSIVSKWQQRWEISESGRFLHNFKPLVDSKPYLDLPSKDLFPTILQLRTGYCSLNESRFKLNQCESSECVCGEIETVQHFILECPLYEDNRQRLQKNLFLQLGIPYLDMDLLLGYSENENISGWRESIICELGQYIANTGRLFSKVADGNAPL